MKLVRSSLVLLFCFLLISHHSIAQNQKEADFKKASDEILQAFSKNKLSELNKYINSANGLYWIYKNGLMPGFTKIKKIDKAFTYGSGKTFLTAAELKKYSLQYGKLPSYACDGGTGGDEPHWTKKGYLADSVKKYKPVSEIAALWLKEGGAEKVTKKDVSMARSVEQNSRKLIFTGSKASGVIFYMTYLDGKWWLSIVDMAENDCEA